MRFTMQKLNGLPTLIAILIASLALPVAVAGDSDSAALELFEKHVRPTLINQCIRCHGPDKQQGGLRLDTREGWAKGGDSGAAIEAGVSSSLLLSAIGYENPDLEMPPRGKLPVATIQAFVKWVELGAIDPRIPPVKSAPTNESAAPDVEQGRSFWSFQPIQNPSVPQVKNATWCANEIDRFVLAPLEQAGLNPGPDAASPTILRRLFYDLTGLPPTPKQIADFQADRSPTAYQDLVDRLLDSHHFGERWGRHWLDVVRFAQSSGGGRTLLLPDAWRYRDYVIDSFNDDVPYNQFLTQQIAGDLLESDDGKQRSRNLIATAFLLLGPTNYEMQDKQILEMDVVDEQLDTMGKALLGMTIGCARCHDHKFDPIPARDYYAMAGILKSTKSLIHSNVSKWNTVNLPLPPEEQAAIELHEEKLVAARARLAQATERWIQAGGNPKSKTTASKSIDPRTLAGIVVDDADAERIGQWTESTSVAHFVGEHYIHDATENKGQKSVVYRPHLAEAGSYEIRVSYTPGSNRSTRVPIHVHHDGGETVVRIDQKKSPDINHALVSLGVFTLDPVKEPRVVVSNEGTEDGVVIADSVVFLSPISDTHRQVVNDPSRLRELKNEVDQLAANIKLLEQSAPAVPVAMSTTDHENADDIHLAIRGQVHQPGPLIPRGVMEVATWEPIDPIRKGQSGRRELAQWITDPRHPLTSRVMVNRVWHWLIGRGIVSTVDNFGSTGELPTNPELLDHLASSFTQQGWSIKQLIRSIVISHVYRLDSKPDRVAQQIDPDNRLLCRMNRKRLRAEDIRDSLLCVGGTLDLTCGGANLTAGTTSEYAYQFQSTRRSVYVPVFRNTLPEIFEVFDFADPNIQRGKRTSSTIAAQALLLMNHPLVIQQSERAASNLLKGPTADSLPRIEQAYAQVLGRSPTEQESSVAVDLVGGVSENESELTRWAMLYQVLFQCLDFRYLD